jgi:hypothetical protein
MVPGALTKTRDGPVSTAFISDNLRQTTELKREQEMAD